MSFCLLMMPFGNDCQAIYPGPIFAKPRAFRLRGRFDPMGWIKSARA